MKLSKKYTSVTPFSRFLSASLFIIFLLAAFYFGYKWHSLTVIKEETALTAVNSNLSTIKDCPQKNYQLIKAFGKIFFLDNLDKYQLDLTNLPNVSITDRDFDAIYVFEMYEKKVSERLGTVSVARFGISKPYEIKDGISLENFAKTTLHYKEGDQYNGAITKTKINNIRVQQTYKGITWDTKQTIEGASNIRDYLIEVDGKYIHFQVYSWDDQSQRQAIRDFEKILSTFNITSTKN